MATIRTDKSTRMTLQVETGTNESGNSVYASRGFSAVNPGLSDANALAIFSAIGELQTHPVNAVIRNDKATLVSA